MIKIQILVEGDNIGDSLKTNNTTLTENAVALRRLEEIKQQLLNIDYENKFEVKEDN